MLKKVSTKTFVNTLLYSDSLFRDFQPTVIDFLALVAWLKPYEMQNGITDTLYSI